MRDRVLTSEKGLTNTDKEKAELTLWHWAGIGGLCVNMWFSQMCEHARLYTHTNTLTRPISLCPEKAQEQQ